MIIYSLTCKSLQTFSEVDNCFYDSLSADFPQVLNSMALTKVISHLYLLQSNKWVELSPHLLGQQNLPRSITPFLLVRLFFSHLESCLPGSWWVLFSHAGHTMWVSSLNSAPDLHQRPRTSETTHSPPSTRPHMVFPCPCLLPGWSPLSAASMRWCQIFCGFHLRIPRVCI